jgi:hypothetical protein
MKLRASHLAIPLALLLVHCEPAARQPKVARRELFASGKAGFDSFFRDVYTGQGEVSTWEDRRTMARKPLALVLRLPADASDVSIFEALHKRVAELGGQAGYARVDVVGSNVKVTPSQGVRVDADLLRGLEASVRAEKERGDRLRQALNKLKEMLKTGQQLGPRIKREFAQIDSSDAKDVEVEWNTAMAFIDATGQASVRSIQETEDFLAAIRRSVGHELAIPANGAPTGPAAAAPAAVTAAPAPAAGVAPTAGKDGRAITARPTDAKPADPKPGDAKPADPKGPRRKPVQEPDEPEEFTP